MITQYLNTLTTIIQVWSTKCIGYETEFAREHINAGFEILVTANTGQDIFGEILCIEFFEVYSSLLFGIFFGSSALYQVLRVSNTQPQQQVRSISVL